MNDVDNIRNLVKRIGSEADTVEDMQTLLVSEIDAYQILKWTNAGHTIELYDKTKVIGTCAIIGELNTQPLTVRQTINKQHMLESRYVEYFKQPINEM